MKTIKDVFDDYRTRLKQLYDADEAEAITLLVISEISSLSKAAVKAFPEQSVSHDQSEKLIDILNRLATGEPVQYILGHTEFYGLPFKVTPAVLIPRPETEELVDRIIASTREGKRLTGSILDIGTGSGCIPISLKKHLQQFQMQGIDISDDALKIANENARLNDVEIDLVKQDILSLKKTFTFHRSPFTSKYDIIVSNPPYVTPEDKTRMHKNVTDFEPHMALFVPEDDPLVFYRAITDFAREYLSENGLLFFEINERFGKELTELLTAKGFVDIELRQDMSGKDRMIKAILSVNSSDDTV